MTTFRAKNRGLLEGAVKVLKAEHPMTLRQLFYRLVSAGLLANAKGDYNRLGNVMTRAREGGAVPFPWLVDHVRATLKPSSWTGLADFGESVRESYRKDFWASLDDHVEIFVEKDAVAGTIQPVTEEYDIRLRVCRGYSSVSFAAEVARLWSMVEKPVFAYYYLGDFDPSGFDLERDLREKLHRYSGRAIYGDDDDCPNEWDEACEGAVFWRRLAVTPGDFAGFDLVRLAVK
jgi:hypothetical protein